MKKYTKRQYIAAVMACYKMDKKQAKQSVKAGMKNGLYGILNAIIDCYMNNTTLLD